MGVRFGLVDGSNAHREPEGALRGAVGEQLGRLSSIAIAHWWGLVEWLVKLGRASCPVGGPWGSVGTPYRGCMWGRAVY